VVSNELFDANHSVADPKCVHECYRFAQWNGVAEWHALIAGIGYGYCLGHRYFLRHGHCIDDRHGERISHSYKLSLYDRHGERVSRSHFLEHGHSLDDKHVECVVHTYRLSLDDRHG
jgi:hypothetical protein